MACHEHNSFSSVHLRTIYLATLLVMFLTPAVSADEPGSCGFRVVNWNASGEDHNDGNDLAVAQAVVKYVQEIDANVITLQEVTELSLTQVEALLPGWRCRWARFGVDYIAVCTDGEPTDFLAKDLSPDPDKPNPPPPPPPPADPWWGYVQVEYQGVWITSVHTRSFWRNHQRAELHANVNSGIVAGDFNHIDADEPDWFQTDLAEEWTWEGEYRGTQGQWKIDHILTVEEPQQVSGDARDKEGSNHRVVVGEVAFQETPSIGVVITNPQQPVEVDEDCMAAVEFRIAIHDNCCLDAGNLALDVKASNPTANAVLSAVSIDSVVAVGPRDVEVTGHVDVSALMSCPAELVIEAIAQDCFGNAGDTASQGTSASLLVLDTTPPVVAESDAALACLWPPNHKYVCFDAGAFEPAVTDNCAATPTWEFNACTSSQPDNARGDGNTTYDCVLDADAQGLCARSERAGNNAEGRRYDLHIGAMDACGNLSSSTEIGNIYIPHDLKPALTCLAPPAN